MIIPVRCFTCGKVLANKWNTFQLKVTQYKKEMGVDPKQDIYVNQNRLDGETPQKRAMDELELTRYCCRRHMMGHVDIIDKI